MQSSTRYPDQPVQSDRPSFMRPSYILGKGKPNPEQIPRVGSRGSFTTPNFSKKYEADRVLSKKMGVTTDQIKREQALKRLGLSEDDLSRAQEIRAIAPRPVEPGNPTKEEQLTGYTAEQHHRRKALDVLGVTEDYIEEQVSKDLGSLGLGARKRSFAHRDNVDDFIRSRIRDLQRSSSRDLVDASPELPSNFCLPRQQSTSSDNPRQIHSAPNESRRQSIKRAIKEIFGTGTFDGEPSYGELWLLYHATLDRKEELEQELAYTRDAVKKLSQFLTGVGYDPSVVLSDDADDANDMDFSGLHTVNELDTLDEGTGARVSPITTPEPTTSRKSLFNR